MQGRKESAVRVGCNGKQSAASAVACGSMSAIERELDNSILGWCARKASQW